MGFEFSLRPGFENTLRPGLGGIENALRVLGRPIPWLNEEDEACKREARRIADQLADKEKQLSTTLQALAKPAGSQASRGRNQRRRPRSWTPSPEEDAFEELDKRNDASIDGTATSPVFELDPEEAARAAARAAEEAAARKAKQAAAAVKHQEALAAANAAIFKAQIGKPKPRAAPASASLGMGLPFLQQSASGPGMAAEEEQPQQPPPASAPEIAKPEEVEDTPAVRAAKEAAMATNKYKKKEEPPKDLTQAIAGSSALPRMQHELQNLYLAQSMQQEVDCDPDVRSLCARFDIEERIMYRLDAVLRNRKPTFAEDLDRLWVRLEHAQNPPGLLWSMIREMEQDKFISETAVDKDIEAFARKHHIDNMAKIKLAEVLEKRPTKAKDLKDLDERIEVCNTPSPLLMHLLKKLANGEALPHGTLEPQPGSLKERRDRAKREEREAKKRQEVEEVGRYRSPPRGNRGRRSRSRGGGERDDRRVRGGERDGWRRGDSRSRNRGARGGQWM